MRRTRDSLNNTELSRLTSATVYDASGDKIGSACQIYLDDQTGEPTFAAVNTGLFGTSESFVPLQGYTWNGDDLVVATPRTSSRTPRASTPTATSPRPSRPSSTATTRALVTPVATQAATSIATVACLTVTAMWMSTATAISPTSAVIVT